MSNTEMPVCGRTKDCIGNSSRASGCVIMASGMGRRFGGNKLMADFGGEPMICRILDATQDVFDRRVVVTRHETVAQLCRSRGIPVIVHDLPYRSDTVRLGLEAMEGTVRCMFCPGDQPLLRRETVQALVHASEEKPDWIWRAACGGIPGSPVVFPAWTYPLLKDLPRGKGGSEIVRRYPGRVRLLDVPDADELRDLDTSEDLKRLSER